MSSLPMRVLTYRAIQSVLENFGWVEIRRIRGRLAFFSPPQILGISLNLELPIPVDMGAPDAENLLFSSLAQMAEIHSLGLEELVRTIVNTDKDVIQSIFYPRHPEAIPLRTAEMFIAQISAFVRANALSEVSPYPAAPKVAKELTRQFLFEHTVKGSFGFRVAIPINTQGDKPTIERKITTRIGRGLQYIGNAVEQSSHQPLVDHAADGFGAPACRALSAIIQNAKSDVRFQLYWSALAPHPQGLPPVVDIKLSQPDRRHLDRAADELECYELSEDEVTITGRATRLHSEEIPLLPFADREITLLWEEEESPLHVKMVLNAEDYAAALKAHEKGHRIVVTGNIERSPTRTRLLNPTLIRVIEGD